MLTLTFPGRLQGGENPYKHIDVTKLSMAELGEIIWKPGGYVGSHLYNLQQACSWEHTRRYEESRRKKVAAQRREIRAKVAGIQKVIDSVRPPTIGTVSGIAIPFGRWGFASATEREVIGPTAFDELLAGPAEVALLADHDPSHVFARRSKFSLRLKKTPAGLHMEADLSPTPEAKDLAALVEAGRIKGISFWIDFMRSEFATQCIGGCRVRYFAKMTISEISLVTSGTAAFPLVGRIGWRRK